MKNQEDWPTGFAGFLKLGHHASTIKGKHHTMIVKKTKAKPLRSVLISNKLPFCNAAPSQNWVAQKNHMPIEAAVKPRPTKPCDEL